MNAKFSRLYSDATYAAVGTTEIASTLRGFDLEIITGTKPKFFGSANKYFDNDAEGLMGFMLTLTLEGNASADTIYDQYRAGTERAVSLRINGSQIGTGTTYNFTFNGYGYYEVVRPVDSEVNGNNLHVAVFHGIEDATGNFMAINVTTNHNTV
jgi:hypothetical protein